LIDECHAARESFNPAHFGAVFISVARMVTETVELEGPTTREMKKFGGWKPPQLLEIPIEA
jgi:hypothetical protein